MYCFLFKSLQFILPSEYPISPSESKLLSHSMARRRTPPKQKPELLVSSLTLTPTTAKIVREIGEDASDRLGWKVGRSAVVRALLSYAGGQGARWIQDNLHPLIEKELQDGIVWGHRRK